MHQEHLFMKLKTPNFHLTVLRKHFLKNRLVKGNSKNRLYYDGTEKKLVVYSTVSLNENRIERNNTFFS